jgi:hypothetical protein
LIFKSTSTNEKYNFTIKARMKFNSFITILFLFISTSANSQNVVIGNPTHMRIKADSKLNTSKCSLRIEINGSGISQDMNKIVQEPEFETSVYFNAQDSAPITVEWSSGPGVWEGLSLIRGCKGQGKKEIIAGLSDNEARQQWNNYFSMYDSSTVECIKGGLNYSNIKIQSSNSDEPIVGPQVLVGSSIPSKCYEFSIKDKSWGKGNQFSFKCTVNSSNSICEGFFVQLSNEGKPKTISTADAIQLHFNGLPWTTGIRETDQGKLARIKNEEEKAKQAIADEKQRQLVESPEYKKIQAELARKESIEKIRLAELAKPKPINRSGLQENTEYVFRDQCKSSSNETCLLPNDYEYLCKKSGVSEMGVIGLAMGYRPNAYDLSKNGNIEKLVVYWNDSYKYKCRVKLIISGIVRGTSTRYDIDGGVSSFKYNSQREIIVYYASHNYY